MHTPISITGIASVSALGVTQEEVWQNYLAKKPLFSKTNALSDTEIWGATITLEAEAAVQKLQLSNSAYQKLDRSVLLAIIASKQAFSLKKYATKKVGINIGSSRGATQLFETYHKQFIEDRHISAFTSPTTTLGNISSWVGQELGVDGVEIGHSVTCSTALHALLNGIAWLRADMADAFIVGGSEAALTPFTIAQMQALKLYSKSKNVMACESLRLQKKENSLVLGEGAGVAVLEKGISERTLAVISGYGFASEKLEHNSSISENAICFQKSMKMALQTAALRDVDVVVMHAPGTVKGDLAEFNAVVKVFGNKLPLLTTNKWIIGHTFGASGMLSVEMGVWMLQHNKLIENPFFENQRHLPTQLQHIMINAVGFGGNAVSIIISKP